MSHGKIVIGKILGHSINAEIVEASIDFVDCGLRSWISNSVRGRRGLLLIRPRTRTYPEGILTFISIWEAAGLRRRAYRKALAKNHLGQCLLYRNVQIAL